MYAVYALVKIPDTNKTHRVPAGVYDSPKAAEKALTELQVLWDPDHKLFWCARCILAWSMVEVP